MSTDYRALCAELADMLEANVQLPAELETESLTLLGRARAALAEPVGEPAPAAAREVGELVRWLHKAYESLCKQNMHLPLLVRAADLLERQAAPPAEGEVGELVQWLRSLEDASVWFESGSPEALKLTRAADLLQQRHPVPVPVAERLQQLEDLAADAVSGLRYIEQTHGRLYGVGWDRVYEKADRLQPGHALPLPAGEVQP